MMHNLDLFLSIITYFAYFVYNYLFNLLNKSYFYITHYSHNKKINYNYMFNFKT